jgi:hypothetical protein
MGFVGRASYLRRTPVRRYATNLVGFPGDANWLHKKVLFFAFINLQSATSGQAGGLK